MDIDGTKRKGDRQGDFPDSWSNLTSYGKRLILAVRLRRGSLLHVKELSFVIQMLLIYEPF
jgi:hypothetical protein